MHERIKNTLLYVVREEYSCASQLACVAAWWLFLVGGVICYLIPLARSLPAN